MNKILIKADADNYTSVAFPSIGTGLMLGYPAVKVAEYMVDEVRKYSSAHPSTGITHVKIVLFERDAASVKVIITL
jgi:O-acetyl-ADP-ribose deacetylase (regulator of RNase III)